MARLWIAFVLVGCCFATDLAAQDAGTTTFFVVRHADRDGDKDNLTKAGLDRAEHLRELMKAFRVQAVYSTNTIRTRKTAAPTAIEIGVDVISYEAKPTAAWFEQLKTKHAGRAVLIVGHSNTCGLIVNGLGSPGKFPIEEDDFDDLFVVTTSRNVVNAVHLEFGAVTKSK